MLSEDGLTARMAFLGPGSFPLVPLAGAAPWARVSGRGALAYAAIAPGDRRPAPPAVRQGSPASAISVDVAAAIFGLAGRASVYRILGAA